MKAVTEADLATAATILSRGAEPSAQAVFLGDKSAAGFTGMFRK